ncbi:PIG-L deacetylase family protein [Athalassotoga saccharophila]|uniref:PIG-L deacetylase family protein n=1 Tax=Athalassotoga saccharophila TaxID=1441386 RepID=UPI00137AC64F|nr:PIG-L family deacetylase [Athalassotoga saccharophila]BBJ27808.1 N-acetyl-alpha-D-glucosaminyl L-malate deacetylase 1 [Athalassotoga saccharophila]
MDKVDILAIGPHPDDVEIGCSGFILKAKSAGYQSQIVVVTDGQAGLSGSQEMRIKEATESAMFLTGKEPIFLHENDGLLDDTLELRTKIANLIRTFRPKIVISPFNKDKHPDHVVLSDITRKAIFMARSNIKALENVRHQIQVHLEMILDPISAGQDEKVIIDLSDVWNDKLKSLDFHRSQKEVIYNYFKFDQMISENFGLAHCELFKLRNSILKNINSFIGDE